MNKNKPMIGKNVKLGKRIVWGNNIVIGDNVEIGNDVQILNNAVIGQLPFKSKILTRQSKVLLKTIISDGVIIGSNVVIY